MAQSSILGGSAAPQQADGRDIDALGPSDTSDSGADVQGERSFATELDAGELGATPSPHRSSSDASGTGERAAADGNAGDDAADILPDHVESDPGAGSAVDDPAAEIDQLSDDDGLDVDDDDDAQDDAVDRP